jgi:hypothetical protein
LTFILIFSNCYCSMVAPSDCRSPLSRSQPFDLTKSSSGQLSVDDRLLQPQGVEYGCEWLFASTGFLQALAFCNHW